MRPCTTCSLKARKKLVPPHGFGVPVVDDGKQPDLSIQHGRDLRASVPHIRFGELSRILGDGVDQGGLVSGHFSDLDFVFKFDAMNDAFGNGFSPFNLRHVFAAALTSLNTINLAVFADSAPFVRTVR